MKEFIEIPVSELGNAQEMIGKDMMLISVTDGEKLNLMTASWGCMGVLWNKNVAVCFVRESRYTYGLLENEDRFTLAFFGGERRDALAHCGRVSGRDNDKLKQLGLTSVELDGVLAVAEAKTVLVCKKLYSDMIDPDGFTDKEVYEKAYGNGDLHRAYVCEIEKVYRRNEE